VELGDALILVGLGGAAVAPVAMFAWKVYRRGFWRVIAEDRRLIERVKRHPRKRDGRTGEDRR
jgi:hypothetical protein